MKMSKEEYGAYVKRLSPDSHTLRDCFRAFWTGGVICVLGQIALNIYGSLGFDEKTAGTMTAITLIVFAAVLTGLGLFGKIAKYAGAGTVVPITGFANSVVSPALEFKPEGYVLGTAAKMFVIAGPVIVYGTIASVIYGVIYWITTLF